MIDRRMLVAVVDTEAGRNAALQAVKLAKSTGSRLTAVSVMPGLDGDVDRLHVGDIHNAMAAPHEKALKECQQLGKDLGLEVRTLLVQGTPHEQIVDQADAGEIDVVILGESRRNLLERAMISPTAARVIGYSQRDVLSIPNGAEIRFGTILVALDGSASSKRAAQRALELAEQYGAKVKAITVIRMLPEYNLYERYIDTMNQKAGKTLAEFNELAASKGVTVDSSMEHGEDVADVIIDQARKQQVDLVITGSHGRTGLRRLLMGSVAENVLAQAPCPVLIIH